VKHRSRSQDGYDALALEMRLGVGAASIDLDERRVTLADGTWADYDRLIIVCDGSGQAAPGVYATGDSASWDTARATKG
jgi:NAD(P)H-nitrite reductase large subunit